MIRSKIVQAIATLSLLCGGALPSRAEAPFGWFVAGSSPQDYEFSGDSTTVWAGHGSALIAAKAGVASHGFGTLMQTVSAEKYRGARWRLSGYLKTSDATRAQMWMRVDGPDRRVVSFDNMDARPIIGTTGWTRYEIVLDVPRDSVDIAFGFLLTQSGKVWGTNFSLENVAGAVPVTAPATLAALPKEPLNMNFASGAATGYTAESVDLYDVYRAEGQLPRKRHDKFTVIDETGSQFYKADKNNLCGMHVAAQTTEPGGTRLFWELKLSVFMQDANRIASLAAGSFSQAPHAETRVPRHQITGLAIHVQNPPATAAARIYDKPNADNGVVGEFPEVSAEQLFDAFDAGTPVTVDFTYDSGERETVLVHTRASVLTKFYSRRNAPTRRCLWSLVPASKEGLRNPLVELSHPW